ncbi:MAG: CPBP family intramembrane glutamic endopeptidase [Anaerolineae bacterium]
MLASPLLIAAIGNTAARLSLQFLGDWAWIGTAPIYFASIVLVVTLLGGRARLPAWFGASRGSLLWPILAVVVGLSPIPMLLLPNLRLLNSPLLIGLWILFALINGSLEEVYWRGFLFDEIQGLPKWVGVVYSSALFVAIHFVMLGVFAKLLANVAFLVILIGITVVYAVMYLRTGSLRWPIVSHILTDVTNMNIFVFMNLIRF